MVYEFPMQKVDCKKYPNLDSKLSALIVEWGNSHNFCSESRGSFLRYGIGFVNSILLLGRL